MHGILRIKFQYNVGDLERSEENTMKLQTLFRDTKLWTISEIEFVFFKDLVQWWRQSIDSEGRDNSPRKLFVLCVNVQTSTVFSIWWWKYDIPWGQPTDLTHITEKVQLMNPNDKSACIIGEKLPAKRMRVVTNC